MGAAWILIINKQLWTITDNNNIYLSFTLYPLLWLIYVKTIISNIYPNLSIIIPTPQILFSSLHILFPLTWTRLSLYFRCGALVRWLLHRCRCHCWLLFRRARFATTVMSLSNCCCCCCSLGTVSLWPARWNIAPAAFLSSTTYCPTTFINKSPFIKHSWTNRQNKTEYRRYTEIEKERARGREREGERVTHLSK